ncbi:MAG: ATP-binding protein [Gemmatimonadota bacterium]
MGPRETSHGPGRPPAPDGTLLRGLRAVGLALALIVVLFALYEVVERTWLAGLTMEQLHRYHQARGITAAALAAAIASWLILRASPALFLDGEGAAPVRPLAMPPSGQEREKRFAEWFILMRWIAVVVSAILVLMSIEVMDYLPESLVPPLLLLIGALILLNVAYSIALRRGVPSRGLLVTQAYGDLVVLTGLLHFSGGIENPLGTLMLLHVIIAGIVLSRRQCYLVAAGGSALFAVMAWGELSGMLNHYTLTIFPHAEAGAEHLHAALDPEYVISRMGLQVVVLFLTAYFTTTVTAQLRRRERQLERSAADALAQSQLLERSLDTTGTALCVCDQELRSSWANPRWVTLFGGRGCGPLGAAADVRARETLRDGSVHVGEVEVTVGGDGDREFGERTFLLTTAPLLDKDGAITHVVELARDVTDLRRIQEGVGRAEQLAAVGELAGKVAHEVNNPIAVISAKTRLLLSRNREELSERVAGELTKITELADRVAHIARGLLTYARPSHGAAAPTDLRVPVSRALSLVEAAAEAGDVEVRNEMPASLPAVHVNAVEIEQVFVNLFMNALDAMPGGGRLSISGSMEMGPEQRRRISVVVEDTGIGIPREFQKQVFEPFLSTKPAGRGTGLGLAICLGLVRSHGGSIDLESEPGRGTRVFVRLPLDDATTPEPTVHA